MEASFTILFLLFIVATTVFWIWALAAYGTGVEDQKGWDKVLKRGYPCSELIDVAQDLPSSVDRVKVAEDLRRAGCEPPPSVTGQS